MSERTKDYQLFRIVLVLGILCYHCGYHLLPGGYSVPFFYILGGFFFHKPDNTSYFSFLKKKIAKLFPFYYACILLSFLLAPPNHIGQELIPNLLLLQAWIPVPNDIYSSYVGGSWFLSSLLFCYICFPFISKTVRNHKYVSFILLAAIILIIRVIDFGDYNKWVKYINPIYCLLEYSIGYAMFHIIKNKHVIHVNPVVVIVVYLLFLVAVHYGLGVMLPFIHIFFIAFLYIFKNQQVEKIISSKYVIQAATYSLHIYLSHLIFLRVLWHHDFSGLLLVVLTVLLSFAFGVLFEQAKKQVLQRTQKATVDQ